MIRAWLRTWAPRAQVGLLFILCGCGDAPPAATPPAPDQATSADVTIIYPLPQSGDLGGLLAGTASGAAGELVPAGVFGLVPGPLDPRPGRATSGRGEAVRSRLRLMAVRIDPCFASRGEVPDAQCKNQIRLSFQGVRVEGGRARGDDGAVHVFVQLGRAELLDFAREILRARDAAGGYTPGPLGVHPLLRRQGLSGSFARALSAAILSHCGAARVSRMTFFIRSETPQSQWFFGVYDLTAGAFVPSPIPTTDQAAEVLNAGVQIGDELSGDMPAPTQPRDDLSLLLSTSQARAAGPAAQRSAFDAALRIENPRLHTPDTIDCVSCHVSTAVRRAAESTLGLSSADSPSRYPAQATLPHEGPARPTLENVHAITYLDDELGLNQRTTNESAEVAAAVTRLLQGR